MHVHVSHEMNKRRACRVINADRKSVRYRSTRDDDASLRAKLREFANPISDSRSAQDLCILAIRYRQTRKIFKPGE